MNRVRLYLHRLLRRPVVTGPFRLYVRPIPGGALLDVEHFLTYILGAIADDEELLALLLEFSADRAQPRPHNSHAPEQLLLERLVSAVGYELPLYGDAVTALANRLRAVNPLPAVRLPEQREAGAA